MQDNSGHLHLMHKDKSTWLSLCIFWKISWDIFILYQKVLLFLYKISCFSELKKMWHGIFSLCLLPEQTHLFIYLATASTNCEFVWGFLLFLSVGQYSESFLQDRRHRQTYIVILTFKVLLTSIKHWKQQCPTQRHLLIT